MQPSEVDMNTSSPQETKTLRIFLIRGVIAIAWAAVFAVVAASLRTDVTVVAGILLVLYPLIDAAATLLDARSQHGSARQWLLVNAGTSTVGLHRARRGRHQRRRGRLRGPSVSGPLSAAAAQLVVVLRRRAQLGNQWPLLLANGVSVIGGVAFLIAAVVANPKLSMLAIYAATGGVEFVIQAWLLARPAPSDQRCSRPERKLDLSFGQILTQRRAAAAEFRS
jgi:hypothetical protein